MRNSSCLRRWCESSVLAFAVLVFTAGKISANDLFGSPRTISIPASSARLIALGDLNNDGNLDIVVAEAGITILLGKGNGTFQTPKQYSANYLPNAFALADVNGDGKLDVVAINSCVGFCARGFHIVQVFLGNGDGTLQSPIFSPTEQVNFGTSVSLAIADFDGDGILDLAATFEQGSFLPLLDYGLIFLGNGDGTFRFGSQFLPRKMSNDPVDLVAADFNGDGKMDLAVIASKWGNVNILLGNGDGTLTLASSLHTGTGRNLAAADINGDGHLDLAVSTDHPLRLAYGIGDGTFQTPLGLSTGFNNPDFDPDPKQVIAADFDGDGRLDLALPLGSNGMLLLYLNKPNGTFERHFFATPGQPAVLAAGDLNNDGYLDIVTESVGSLDVFLNRSATTLSPENLAFAPQAVGSISPPKIVTLKNSGKKTLNILGISITGAGSGSFSQTNSCSSSLTAGTSCTISVTFQPKALGTREAAVSVKDDGVGTPHKVALSGVGTQ